MKRVLAVLFLFFITPTTIALAEDTNDSVKESSSAFLLFKLLIYFGLVLLLLYLFFYFVLKKNQMAKSSTFHHLGGISLGQNKTLQAVEIGNKIYILGVGEDVSLVDIVDSEEDKESINHLIETSFQPSNRFAVFLKSIGTRFKKNHSKQKHSFEAELAEKIEQMKDKRVQQMNKLFNESEESQLKKDRDDEKN